MSEPRLSYKDLHGLVSCLLQIPGIDRLSGFRALQAGLDWSIRQELPGSSLDWKGYTSASRIHLTLLLRDALEYPETYGWDEKDGEEPLAVILQNALFLAPADDGMIAVHACLKKIQATPKGEAKG